MKHKALFIILTSLLINSCYFNDNIFDSSSFNDVSFSSETQSTTSSDTSSLNEDFSSSSNQESSTEEQAQINYDFNYEAKENEEIITINQMQFIEIGNYSTGNYSNCISNKEMIKVDGINFEYYRAIRDENAMTLLPYTNQNHKDYIPGSFYNTSVINNITRVILSYYCEENDTDGLTFRYGNDRSLNNSLVLPASKDNVSLEITLSNTCFIKFDTIAQKVTLNCVYIYYDYKQINYNSSYLSHNSDEFRLNPITYQNELIDNVSKVDVPIDISIDEETNSYVVNEYKTYTYYSYDYIVSHPEYINDAIMITPRDVINYYIAFRRFPVNYFDSASSAIRSEAYDLFGDNIRQVSDYSRTNGYVNKVPCNLNNILYYEFDIDIDKTYIVNKRLTRGVGRVIIFDTGFNAPGYDTSPVGVFSDDHYSTFQEYLNTGKFSKRFNCQANVTPYIW
ncbi:MAG: hypothetical protein MR270_02115 [Erysipelotrichaceae bacterium]|nr:hypothetical protein [Erysipelotrichaceae bacterium]